MLHQLSTHWLAADRLTIHLTRRPANAERGAEIASVDDQLHERTAARKVSYSSSVSPDGSTTGWLNDTAGASLIAVHEHKVALIGGYNGLFDRIALADLGDSIVDRPSRWQLVLPGGGDLPTEFWMSPRCRYIHVLSSNTWFRLDIATLRG